MRVLLCGQVEAAQAQAARDTLAEAAHAWGVETILCAGEGLPTAHCESLGVEIKTVREPDPAVRLETLGWLIDQGMLDRIIALPEGGCPLSLHVKAVERRVPVYELSVQAGEGRLEPLPLSRARARWLRARAG